MNRDAEFWALVDACLDERRDPREDSGVQRWTEASPELAARLESLVSTLGALAGLTSASGAPPWTRPRRWIAAALVLFGVGIAVARLAPAPSISHPPSPEVLLRHAPPSSEVLRFDVVSTVEVGSRRVTRSLRGGTLLGATERVSSVGSSFERNGTLASFRAQVCVKEFE